MSQESTAVIGKAAEIINRFGGIRPMSTKTGIPVTTIQGWKQRNAIPMSRRYELIEAANKHGVNLSDLLVDMIPQADHGYTPAQKPVMHEKNGETVASRPVHSDLRPASNQTAFIAAGALILAAAIGGIVLAITPKVTAVEEQTARIRELEAEVARMKEDNPDSPNFVAKIDDLEGKIGALGEQAKSYSAVIEDLRTGSVGERISKLEGHVGNLIEYANAQGLQSMIEKIVSMQSTPEGQSTADGVVATFSSVMGVTPPEQVDASLQQLKTSNPAVAEVFKDVAPQDMKAAVMLFGMAQLRESLARDRDSFEQDLALLKMSVAQNDPALQQALDRLAPQANRGVLTPQGLSNELKGLTGDIVAASLAGENISIEEKAKARLGQIINVEKGGARISGTNTQILVAEAQKKLDAGDVAGAMAILQQVEGPAAQKVQPLIDEAQLTMLASNVRNLLGNSIVLKLKGRSHGAAPYTASGGSEGLTPLINQINSVGQGISGALGATGGQ